jgi:hypothetical protein
VSDESVAAWIALVPQSLFRSSFGDCTIMQHQIPQNAQQLQSRRFLTHQPTYAPAPMLERKQKKIDLARSPLVGVFFLVVHLFILLTVSYQVSPQPIISDDAAKNSVPKPPSPIGHFARSYFDSMVTHLRYLPCRLLNTVLGLSY